MAIDADALTRLDTDPSLPPVLRFFEWLEPALTHGYLLDAAQVKAWAAGHPGLAIAQRPTGGGAVRHDPADLSVSILWPRGKTSVPVKARDAYAFIHGVFDQALKEAAGLKGSMLHVKPGGACEAPVEAAPTRHFSVCFEEPVCNDVMAGGRKIAGGALRLTRNAVLYQGTIQLAGLDKRAAAAAIERLFLSKAG